MMRIFGTGLSGYIGRNLVRHLQEINCDYVNFDMAIGYDVSNCEQIEQLMAGCDVVVHLAALPSIPYCEDHPTEAITVNLLGTINVASIAEGYKIPTVFVSTFAAKNPVNIYGMTKRLGEEIIIEKGGVVLRLANVYGGIDYLKLKSSVVSNFVNAKKNLKPVTIYGDGSAKRDFVHVVDVCKAIVMSIKAPPGVYEVCTGKQISIKELAVLVGVEYRFAPPRKGDVKHVPSSPEYDLPGWSSRLGLKEGLGGLFK